MADQGRVSFLEERRRQEYEGLEEKKVSEGGRTSAWVAKKQKRKIEGNKEKQADGAA